MSAYSDLKEFWIHLPKLRCMTKISIRLCLKSYGLKSREKNQGCWDKKKKKTLGCGLWAKLWSTKGLRRGGGTHSRHGLGDAWENRVQRADPGAQNQWSEIAWGGEQFGVFWGECLNVSLESKSAFKTPQPHSRGSLRMICSESGLSPELVDTLLALA